MKKLVETMFWIENQIQLCHWQQESGYKHQVLGDFYKEMNKQIDRFVETCTGYFDDEILFCNEVLFKLTNDYDLIKLTDAICKEFEEYKIGLVKLELHPLINLIEEIQAIIIRYKYLLLKK